MEYLATFYTHFGAVKYHRYLRLQGIGAEMMPIPRKYSNNCGIGVKFAAEVKIEHLISEEIEKVFLIMGNQDQLIFHSESQSS